MLSNTIQDGASLRSLSTILNKGELSVGADGLDGLRQW